MPDAPLLTPEERQALLPPLGEQGWSADPDGDALRKLWRFRSFSEAWAFLSRVALLAEKRNHHPDWSNRYNLVDLRLTTHAAGGLTTLDTAMAPLIDRLAGGAETVPTGEPVACLCEERAGGTRAPGPPRP